ncbi:MAG TPA: carboxypeptidase-like regulatory domain-containing protein, partial [Terriglobales bacterium]
MSRIQRSIPIVCLLAILLVPASQVNAQGIGGAISGQVVDQSGGAVVGATVRIVNRATNQSRSVGTGADGRYEARELPPGRYTVTIENPGFKIVEIGNLNIGVGQNARLQTITVEPVPVEVTET